MSNEEVREDGPPPDSPITKVVVKRLTYRPKGSQWCVVLKHENGESLLWAAGPDEEWAQEAATNARDWEQAMRRWRRATHIYDREEDRGA